MYRFSSCYQSSGVKIPLLWRLLASTLLVWSGLGFYFIVSQGQSNASTTLVMPSWVPFWPAFALPYLGMLVVAWLLPVAISDAARFRACLRALVYAYLLIVPWWLLMPTILERPSVSEGAWNGPYLWIAAHDRPSCVMPCAHGIGAVVAAWFVGLERPTWRWPLVGILAVGMPSITLIGQHRPVDILLGTAAAAVGIAIAEALNYREQRRRKMSDEIRRKLKGPCGQQTGSIPVRATNLRSAKES